MKKLLIFLISVFLSFELSAQTTISGFIADSLGVPLPYSHVYLAETTIGAIANSAGFYRLTVPEEGNYQLTVSCVGFKIYSQIVRANGGLQQLDIVLKPKIIVLSEVKVSANGRNRWENLRLFMDKFIGRSNNSVYCRILNRKDLVVYTDSNDSVLTAFSRKPLIIRNHSLGYKLYFDLEDFHYNLKTGHLQFKGPHYFQELKGGKARKEKWQISRLKTYYGSKMQLLRALYKHTLKEEDFIMQGCVRDSTNEKWEIGEQVNENDLYQGFNSGTVTLFYPTPILVTYTYDHPEPLDIVIMPRQFESLMIFSDSLKVYKNGYYPNPYGVSWGGGIGLYRVADMLPFDFLPVLPEDKTKKKKDNS